jgi:hypothetical protein
MSVWKQGAENAYPHGWNGSGSEADANLLAAAFLLNFDPRVFHQANYERMTRFLATLAPPPFPGRVDASLAAQGRELFDRHCADCHDPRGRRIGHVTPIAEVGTSAHYVQTWRTDVVQWLRELRRGPFAFSDLVYATGFVNLPLTGLWLRGPYLHNGSVPTVRDLLLPPEQRPQHFWRGYDVVDAERLGFLADGAAAQAAGFRQNNQLPGNEPEGHRYGTELPETDRRALLEYLKTL